MGLLDALAFAVIHARSASHMAAEAGALVEEIRRVAEGVEPGDSSLLQHDPMAMMEAARQRIAAMATVSSPEAAEAELAKTRHEVATAVLAFAVRFVIDATQDHLAEERREAEIKAGRMPS